MRDYSTLIEAMRGTGLTLVIPEFSYNNAEHRDRLGLLGRAEQLPPNVKIVPDDGDVDTLITNMARARIVAIPTYHDSLCASGLSTYLNAMWMGKCVVMSRGPGASDLLTNEAALVPPEDAAALRQTIVDLWNNTSKRHQYAVNGKRYAALLGTESDFLHRVLTAAVRVRHHGAR